MDQIFLLTIPLIFSLVHYLGLRYEIRSKNFSGLLQSFAAGFSIAYVFLLLLEEVNVLEEKAQIDVMILVLLGFVFFHTALKFVFQRRDKKKRIVLLDEIHLVTLGIYNFVITFSLVELSMNDLRAGILLSALLLIHFALSDLSNDELHNSPIRFKSTIIIIGTFLGAVLALLDILSVTATAIFYAFAAGAIIYMTIREEVPDEDEGRPLLFLVGALLFSLLSLAI